jgi:hypothetical protein
VFFAVLCATLSPAWAGDEIPERARISFANGVELLQQDPPQYQDAYHQFLRAYEVSDSWKVLGNLGLCALKLERDGEALQHYRAYLERGGSQIDPEERAAIKREMVLLEGNIVYVDMRVDGEGVIVTDTRMGSSAAPQAYVFENAEKRVGVRAGSHSFIATRGEEQRTWKVTLVPGQSYEHLFAFEESKEAKAAAYEPATPKGASVGAKEPAESEAQQTTASPWRTVGYVVTGLGVLSAGAGVFTGLKAKQEERNTVSEVRSDPRLCRDDLCGDDAERAFNSARGLATTTNVLFAAAGVLTVTGLVLVFASGNDAPSEDAVTISLAPFGAGLRAAGSF